MNGPEKILPDLFGKYKNRSIIFIELESHRASDIAALGKKAFNHKPLSPRLSALAGEGLLFTNYVASGKKTQTSLWSLISGLPNPKFEYNPTHQAPEAAKLGRLPDFKDFGYSIQALRSAISVNQNWAAFLSSVGADYTITAKEKDSLSREFWGPWGMPDDQLYNIALNRYKKTVQEKKPAFMWVLTASNHHPWVVPDTIDGTPLAKDYTGGMTYADYCLGVFIDNVRLMPEEEQPIIFITSDTSHGKGLEQLIEDPESNKGIMERIRLPGLLLLPDKHMGGKTFDGLFSHEDTFDLLWGLINKDAKEKSEKFINKHRAIASFDSQKTFVSKNTFYDVLLDKFMKIDDQWDLVDGYNNEEAASITKGMNIFLKDEEKMWRPKGYNLRWLRVDEQSEIKFHRYETDVQQ